MGFGATSLASAVALLLLSSAALGAGSVLAIEFAGEYLVDMAEEKHDNWGNAVRAGRTISTLMLLTGAVLRVAVSQS